MNSRVYHMKIWILYMLFVYSASPVLAQDQEWTSLLQKYVNPEGLVDYKNWQKDSLVLNSYLLKLTANPPQKSWSSNKIKAYWINAYNAFTIQLVLRHYPINGIKEIGGKIPFVNSSWDIKFIRIGNELLDLNNIEHTKLRKNFNDPRIHVALVCASRSCPPLLREAYSEQNIEEKLELQCKTFLQNERLNKLSANGRSEISMIFNWYEMDFGGKSGVKKFINRYVPGYSSSQHRHSFKNFNWSLNDLDVKAFD